MLVSRQSRRPPFYVPRRGEIDNRDLMKALVIVMADLAQLKLDMDAAKAAVAANTNVVASAKGALEANTAMIATLAQEVADLKAQGAGNISQEDLDALDKSAQDIKTTADQSVTDLSAAVAANTPAAQP